MPPDSNKPGMPINDYQRKAFETNQINKLTESISNSIENLSEEVGSLLECYQQDLYNAKDEKLTFFNHKAPSKLGDMLWYISSIATKINVNLDEIAQDNLDKAKKRWRPSNEIYRLYDEDCPPHEQLPRKVKFYIKELSVENNKVTFGIETKDGLFIPLGDRIDDNARCSDGYRFHDVLHIAYAAYLGWSPVLRALLRHKRKSNPRIDVVEDGARSIDLEEALTAMIFEHAKELNFFEGYNDVDFNLTKLVEKLTITREVCDRSPIYWKEAILKGYEVFRKVKKNKSGVVSMDLNKREIGYESLSAEKSKLFFGE